MLKLLAPLDGNDDFELLAASPADEFYFGFLPTTHVERYTNLYSLNRRAYTRCNFSDWESLGQAMQALGHQGKKASCAFNSTYYLDGEYPIILGHAQRMLELGVSAVIVSDPGLMSYLRDNGYDGDIHAGIDTPIFNAEGVQFLHEQFAVRRVVVNRHMELSEVRGMTAAAPEGVEFDIIVRNAACRHIAGFCGNLHGLDVPSGLDNWEERQFPCWQPMKVVGVNAVEEVDAVMLKVWLERSSSLRYGGCGACALRDIGEVGITHLKIAGRGSTTRKKLTDIRFIAAARQLGEVGGSLGDYRTKVKALYSRFYEGACSPEECFHG